MGTLLAYMSVHHMCICRNQKRVTDPLKLEILYLVLGFEQRTPGRAASAPNPGAISPALTMCFLITSILARSVALLC